MSQRDASHRHASSEHPSGTDDRLYLVRTNFGRWTASAVAAALALPLETCDGTEAWADLMDRLDAAIEDVLAG